MNKTFHDTGHICITEALFACVQFEPFMTLLTIDFTAPFERTVTLPIAGMLVGVIPPPTTQNITAVRASTSPVTHPPHRTQGAGDLIIITVIR